MHLALVPYRAKDFPLSPCAEDTLEHAHGPTQAQWQAAPGMADSQPTRHGAVRALPCPGSGARGGRGDAGAAPRL